jgi:hypothetical protein
MAGDGTDEAGQRQTALGKERRYLTATTASGLLIIHSSPVTLSWVPRDVVNDVYNVGGTVTVGTFDSLDEAKQTAREQYSTRPEDWQSSDLLPFESGAGMQTEIHTPEIDGHHLVRHGIRWK